MFRIIWPGSLELPQGGLALMRLNGGNQLKHLFADEADRRIEIDWRGVSVHNIFHRIYPLVLRTIRLALINHRNSIQATHGDCGTVGLTRTAIRTVY